MWCHLLNKSHCLGSKPALCCTRKLEWETQQVMSPAFRMGKDLFYVMFSGVYTTLSGSLSFSSFVEVRVKIGLGDMDQ